MNKVKTILCKGKVIGYEFFCFSCGHNHRIIEPNWKYNHDPVSPTIKPSLLISTKDEVICHLWVTDGFIDYKDDGMPKPFAGTKVEMKEIERIEEVCLSA